MGYEKTLPRNQIIFATALGAGVTLFALHFFFDSYFAMVTTRAMNTRVLQVTTTNVEAVKADALTRLNDGKMPVARAMTLLAKDGRPSEIMPKLEEDNLAALEGWVQSPAPKESVERAKRAHALWRYHQLQARLEAARQSKTDKGNVAQLEAELAKSIAEYEKLGGKIEAGKPSEEAPAAPEGSPTPGVSPTGEPATGMFQGRPPAPAVPAEAPTPRPKPPATPQAAPTAPPAVPPAAAPPNTPPAPADGEAPAGTEP